MMLRHMLNSLRARQGSTSTSGRQERADSCIEEMACTAGDEPTAPQRQMQAEAETPAAVCRAGWAWVREYVHDLREDYANRVGAP